MKWPSGVPDDLSQKKGLRGLRWTIAEAAAQQLSSLLLDNPEDFLHTNPPQRLLKESPVRTVSICSGPHGDLFLKGIR
jgi:hypothetical protein